MCFSCGDFSDIILIFNQALHRYSETVDLTNELNN